LIFKVPNLIMSEMNKPEPEILENTPFESASLSFVGRNLAVLFDDIENVDAESTYNNSNAQGLDYYGLPQTRSYGFNLVVTF